MPDQPIRAVVDTSVLVPARLRAELQSLAYDGAFTAIWSPWIIAELYRTLTWQWIERTVVSATTAAGDMVTACDLTTANWTRCGESAKRMMEILLSTPNWELVDPRPPYPPVWESLDDIWDYPIWAAAVVGHARYVVSNNTHDYPPAGADGRHVHDGIEYVSGTDFLALLS
ncbi:MAG TPA: PIN domain-containing protein [Chloroflexota bacterium]|nr:PIN domain-containing protein [Chloroflexota bacterium]